jgi:hypothetical protein
LEQGQLVQLIIIVINDGKSTNLRMLLEPRKNFIAPGPVGHVRCNADERNAVVPGAEKTCRVVTPCGG